MNDSERTTAVRLQTSSDAVRAEGRYRDLMQPGQSEALMIIARLSKGRGYHVLGQGMRLADMARALRAAAEAVARAVDRHLPHRELGS